jgi:hypothetical protein
MRNFELTPIECQKLKKAHRHAKEKWAADRLKAIYLLGTGWTLEKTAEALMVDIETLRNWIDTEMAVLKSFYNEIILGVMLS